MDRVPRDILMDILSRLPVKYIARCRCVCKTMDAIASEPLFFTLQSNQFSKHNPSIVVLSSEKEKLYLVDDHDNDLPPPIIRPTSLKFPFFLEPLSTHQRHGIIGTCNGLLCYSKFLKRNSFVPMNPIYVFNPLTGEHIRLPNFKVAATYYTVCVSGFGFDNSKQEYKVVLALFNTRTDGTVEKKVLIHTLGTNTWRRGNCEVPSVLEHSYVNTSTASLNGSLHWIMLSYTSGTDSSNPHHIRRVPIIVSFDLGSEDFDFIPLPTSLISTWAYLHCSIMRFDPLGVLRGCLSIVNVSYIGHKNCEIDVWVMKKYKDQESWVKQYVIARNCLEPGGDNIFPVCILMNGGILMVRGSEVLVCDNIESGKYKTLEVDGSLKKQYEEDCVAIPFMGSLISLKQVLEERRNRKPTLKKRRIQLVEGSKQVVKKKPTKGYSRDSSLMVGDDVEVLSADVERSSHHSTKKRKRRQKDLNDFSIDLLADVAQRMARAMEKLDMSKLQDELLKVSNITRPLFIKALNRLGCDSELTHVFLGLKNDFKEDWLKITLGIPLS